MSFFKDSHYDAPKSECAKCKKLTAQNAELLAALQKIVKRSKEPGAATGTQAVYCFMIADAAIAKMEAGK